MRPPGKSRTLRLPRTQQVEPSVVASTRHTLTSHSYAPSCQAPSTRILVLAVVMVVLVAVSTLMTLVCWALGWGRMLHCSRNIAVHRCLVVCDVRMGVMFCFMMLVTMRSNRRLSVLRQKRNSEVKQR